MIIAAALRELMAAGLAGEELIAAIARIEAAAFPPPQPIDFRGPLLEAENLACFYCGAKKGHYHRDHVIPRSRGGSSDPSNLVIACAPCNLSKGARTPEEWRGAQ